jgi:hypothetical protein
LTADTTGSMLSSSSLQDVRGRAAVPVIVFWSPPSGH